MLLKVLCHCFTLLTNNKMDKMSAGQWCFCAGRPISQNIHECLVAVYGDAGFSLRYYEKMGKEIQCGSESFQNDVRSGRLSAVISKDNIKTVSANYNKCIKIYGYVERIPLGDLHMSNVYSRLVPKMLTAEMKESRVTNRYSLSSRYIHDP